MIQIVTFRDDCGVAGMAKLAMGDEQASRIQELIDRVQRGDQEARRELIDCAYERLRRLSAVILRRSFPRLKDAPALVNTTDVANESAYRLYQALGEIQPATVRDFFRLAAQRIRWLLLDLARESDRGERHGLDDRQLNESYSTSRQSEPPAVLAELYQQIDGLPEHEREVVDLLYFHGLSQVETANQLGVTERTVRRYWTAARVRLFEALNKSLPPTVGPVTIESLRIPPD